MTAPTPAQFDAAVDDALKALLRLAPKLKAEYRWAHGAAHERTVTDSEKVRTGMSSPTEAVFMSKRKMREVCESANKVIQETPNDWKDSIRALESVMKFSNPVSEYAEQRPLGSDTWASNAAKDEARAAAARRFERGEAIP